MTSLPDTLIYICSWTFYILCLCDIVLIRSDWSDELFICICLFWLCSCMMLLGDTLVLLLDGIDVLIEESAFKHDFIVKIYY